MTGMDGKLFYFLQILPAVVVRRRHSWWMPGCVLARSDNTTTPVPTHHISRDQVARRLRVPDNGQQITRKYSVNIDCQRCNIYPLNSRNTVEYNSVTLKGYVYT